MPPSRPPRILALGGGGFSMEPDNLALDRHLLALTGAPRPKVCFVPTASGDSEIYIARFLAAYRTLDCEPSVLSLFRRSIPDLRAHVLAQDAIFVGGGNTMNLLALWRLHGLDAILREAWDAGVVLAGVSAGALCWFDAGITDSLGPLSSLRCLGWLPGSIAVHYDGEAERRPVFHRSIGEGMPEGYGVEDGVALCFQGTDLEEIVASRPGSRAYRVGRQGAAVVETPLEARVLV